MTTDLEEKHDGRSNSTLLGLEKKSLREQALAALRTAITSGELEPGRHLVETELSEMLQISRGTLREALRQLEQEGLLSAGARGRLSVRHLDAKEIRDIFSVRAALESLAARSLCELPDRQHVIAFAARSHRGHGRGRRRPAWRNGSNPTWTSTAPCAGSPATRPCCTPGSPWRAPSGCPSCLPGSKRAVRNMSVDRHHDIVAAIETGDASLARKTILEHMDVAAANLVALAGVSSPRSRRRRC